ncbi:MAG: STAS/SEC14 domain-containing protein [Anaerolineae bacterium]
MPTIQITMELPSDELLKAVEQLSLPDLEQFAQQIVRLLARRRAPVLPRREAELLLKINQSAFPVNLQARCDALVAKRQEETLTPGEREELMHLTDQLGELNVQRLEYLAELARLRQTSLPALMEDLGIQVPAVV